MVGFGGDNDLYGLGIRIGYYTAAVSIWIGNLWAPSEIYFLRHVTIVFLVAMLIGVSVLSFNPSGTFAIEPFMLMHVSYCTYYMGLLIPPSPEFLSWEKEYFSFYVTAIVGIALHSYDTWYWWIGQSLMKPTPGTKTLALLIYFGQVDIFGWIRYVVRAYLIYFIYIMLKHMVRHHYYHRMEKKLDHEVPPARLKMLCENWQNELEAATGRDMMKDGIISSPPLLSTPFHDRKLSANSFNSLGDTHRRSTSSKTEIGATTPMSASLSFEDLKKANYESKSRDSDDASFAPEPGITRTMSEKLRYHILGWRPDYNLGTTQVYTYHPSLESVDAACHFLIRINKCYDCRFKYLYGLADCFYSTFWAVNFGYLTQGYHPRFILAVSAHLDALIWKRKLSYDAIFRRVINSPEYHTLQPEDIALASRILLTTDPLGKPNRTHIFGLAYALFATCSLLVIGTELTIQWNYISNVQNLSTVGQLIPAAIGVGGLARVIYSAIFEKGKEADCLNRCRIKPRRKAWKEAGDAYEKAIKALERRKESKGKAKEKEKEKEVA